MTPIDNAILSEMLDNCLSDVRYLRAEVASLREAKAEAKAEAYELREELDSRDEELRQALRSATTAHTEAKGIIEALREHQLVLQQDFREANGDKYAALNEVKRLKDEVEHDDKRLDEQAVRIAELEDVVAGVVQQRDSATGRITELQGDIDLFRALNQSLADEAKDRYESEQRLRDEVASAEERIAELEEALARAVSRADENANLLSEAEQVRDTVVAVAREADERITELEQEVEDRKADADALDWYQGETKRLTEQAQTFEGRLADCRESLRQSERDLADAEDQLALYADNCECSQ